MKKIRIVVTSLLLVSTTLGLTGYLISFGLNFPVYKDGGLWVRLKRDDSHLSSSMRLAEFLQPSPLELTNALNLDGGPVAWQEIDLAGFERTTYGRWEMRTEDDDALLLLTVPRVHAPLRIVLAVFPK